MQKVQCIFSHFQATSPHAFVQLNKTYDKKSAVKIRLKTTFILEILRVTCNQAKINTSLPKKLAEAIWQGPTAPDK